MRSAAHAAGEGKAALVATKQHRICGDVKGVADGQQSLGIGFGAVKGVGGGAGAEDLQRLEDIPAHLADEVVAAGLGPPRAEVDQVPHLRTQRRHRFCVCCRPSNAEAL